MTAGSRRAEQRLALGLLRRSGPEEDEQQLAAVSVSPHM
jgi:hypothetical protein